MARVMMRMVVVRVGILVVVVDHRIANGCRGERRHHRAESAVQRSGPSHRTLSMQGPHMKNELLLQWVEINLHQQTRPQPKRKPSVEDEQKISIAQKKIPLPEVNDVLNSVEQSKAELYKHS